MTHYLIYKIINKLNGKIYIGSHKTKKLDDGYMGSGIYLNRAIEKYGLENFSKEILHDFDNPDDMYAKEAELVNKDYLMNENTYNLNVGGLGGWDYVNVNGLGGFTSEIPKLGRKITDSNLEKIYGANWRSILGRMGEAARRMKYGPLKPSKESQHKAMLAALMPEARRKRKLTLKKIKHQQGIKNSVYGKHWYTDGKNSIMAKVCPEGWRPGRI